MNQRWRLQRTSYRPAGETIKTSDYEVSALDGDTEAKAFILSHHYAGSYPAARFRFGLHLHGALVGVAVFSHPCNDKVLTSVFPGAATDSVELGRFVLLDAVPGNGETWFLGQAFRRLKAIGLRGVVSFSDPIVRTKADGATIFKGHVGTIYQAHNGVYLGRGTKRTLKLLPDGRVFNDRAAQKIRAGERGWRAAAGQLEKYGAPSCPAEHRADWLETWTTALTRRLKHTGNHRYAWSFGRPILRWATQQPYPKKESE